MTITAVRCSPAARVTSRLNATSSGVSAWRVFRRGADAVDDVSGCGAAASTAGSGGTAGTAGTAADAEAVGTAASAFGASGAKGAAGAADVGVASAGGALGSGALGCSADAFDRASGLPISTTVTVVAVAEVEVGVSARNAMRGQATNVASKRDNRVFMVKGEEKMIRTERSGGADPGHRVEPSACHQRQAAAPAASVAT